MLAQFARTQDMFTSCDFLMLACIGLLAAMFRQRSKMVCDCSADLHTLGLLKAQLDRSGPENLPPAFAFPARGLTEVLLPRCLALVVGTLIRCVVTTRVTVVSV